MPSYLSHSLHIVDFRLQIEDLHVPPPACESPIGITERIRNLQSKICNLQSATGNPQSFSLLLQRFHRRQQRGFARRIQACGDACDRK
jgi:hypothetical protein